MSIDQLSSNKHFSFAYLRHNLRSRRDSEYEQALIRLILGAVLCVYLFVNLFVYPLHGGSAVIIVAIPILYLVAIGILVHILFRPNVNPTRRILGQLIDILAASICLYWGGEVGAPAYGLYLWVIVGNAFRFGIPYMFSATALSIGAFVTIALFAPFWSKHATLSVGLLITLLMVPAYLAALLRRLEASNRAIESLARQDSLTGVLNRRAMEERLEHELARIQRHGGQLAIAMFDIDGFKPINDRYGHFMGDEVLRAVVARTSRALRECDYIARFGGDEFVLVLPGADERAAHVVAERLRCAIVNQAFTYEGQSLEFSISIGVSHWVPGDSVESLLHKADVALYYSKNTGRNRVSRFDELPDADTARLTDRERQILKLIATGRSNELIARELDIAEATVKVHVKNMLKKLNLKSRVEAAVWAVEHGHGAG